MGILKRRVPAKWIWHFLHIQFTETRSFPKETCKCPQDTSMLCVTGLCSLWCTCECPVVRRIIFCGLLPLTSLEMRTRTILKKKKLFEIITRNYLARARRVQKTSVRYRHFDQPNKPFLHGFFPSWMEPSFLAICRQQLSNPPSVFSIHSSFRSDFLRHILHNLHSLLLLHLFSFH